MKAVQILLPSILLACYSSYGHSLPVHQGPSGEKPDHEKDSHLCSICLDGVKLFQQAVDSNLTLDTIYPVIHALCLDTLQSGGPYTCPGFIYSYGPVVLYVLSHIFIEPRVICRDLNYCKKSDDSTLDMTQTSPDIAHALNKLKKKITTHHTWNTSKESLADISAKLKVVQLPQYRAHNRADSLQESVATLIQTPGGVYNRTVPLKSKVRPKNGVIRFLQLSDIHVDHQYDEGSPSDCGLYMCCRHWYNGTGKAGHFGAYHCDLPMPTLELLTETLQELDPQPDFIIYTGDNAPHDVWNETWSSQLYATKFIVNYLSEKFPKMTIYPAVGNHESWPESEYFGTMLQYQALTRNLAEYWQSWADFPQEALDTIAVGGYYNVPIADNLRVISFNSDYGYSLNFYSYLNSINDHYKTQQYWIEKQLQLAEQQGDKVLLIAHIPPGDTDNHAEYGEFYLNITRRYRHTIVGHLFGHTHTDQFQLVQDVAGVYGVALIAPSVTPYGHINPSFRVFTMDAESKTLLGYEQYHLNLTLANELYKSGSDIKPQFRLSYTTSGDYGLKDLSPDEWTSMVSRFETEPSLLEKYSFNVHAKSVPSDKTCDQSCKKRILCSVTNVISSHYVTCQEN